MFSQWLSLPRKVGLSLHYVLGDEKPRVVRNFEFSASMCSSKFSLFYAAWLWSWVWTLRIRKIPVRLAARSRRAIRINLNLIATSLSFLNHKTSTLLRFCAPLAFFSWISRLSGSLVYSVGEMCVSCRLSTLALGNSATQKAHIIICRRDSTVRRTINCAANNSRRRWWCKGKASDRAF